MTRVVMPDEQRSVSDVVNWNALIIIIALIAASVFVGIVYGEEEVTVNLIHSTKPVKYREGHLGQVDEVETQEYEEGRALISHYRPDLGGPNCFSFVNGKCVSPTASGRPWQEGINEWLACPAEFEFGTIFILPGGEEFTCYDRGGKIVTNPDGTFWLDLLLDGPSPVPYGTEMTVKIIRPQQARLQ